MRLFEARDSARQGVWARLRQGLQYHMAPQPIRYRALAEVSGPGYSDVAAARYQIGEDQARSCIVAGLSCGRGSPWLAASRVVQRGVSISSTRR